MRPAVWAPDARQVALSLPGRQSPLVRGSDGWWASDMTLPAGERYGFRVDDGPIRPDPRSLSQPDGPHRRSEVVELGAHTWRDGAWAGISFPDAVIYELHVGTFTRGGTLDAAIERLDHLVALGVTLVELMPVAAFPGSRGWGYDGVDPYAVHVGYGGAAALQRFVDACHLRGLGVCLDVVYNHLGPSGNYLGEFGPYFTDRYATPWGWAVNLDGPGSDQVRAYLIDNARMWLRDFHIDALRLDAVHALHDERATGFLAELHSAVRHLSEQLGRPLVLIAESDRNDPFTVRPPEQGGDGMDAQWADDVHHSLHVLLTGETQGYYADFTDSLGKTLQTPFFHDGTWSSFRCRRHGRPIDPDRDAGWRFVASLQTHDQVGNRAAGDRLSSLVPPGRLACGAAILLTGPYTPMLFMGEEWAAGTPWQYFTDHQEPDLAAAVSRGRREEFAEHGWAQEVPDPQAVSTFTRSVLDWSEPAEGVHARMLGWYRTLLALRRAVPELRDPELGRSMLTRGSGVLTVHRGAWTVAANLTDAPCRHPLAPGEVVHAAWDGQQQGAGITLAADGVAVIGPLLPWSHPAECAFPTGYAPVDS